MNTKYDSEVEGDSQNTKLAPGSAHAQYHSPPPSKAVHMDEILSTC